MKKKTKIILTIAILIILFLAWAPWMNKQKLHDKIFKERSKIDGTIDKVTGELICDYSVTWIPFGRAVKSCEAGYYITFYGQTI